MLKKPTQIGAKRRGRLQRVQRIGHHTQFSSISGTTSGVKIGDTTTPPKALARALTDVQQFEGALKTCVTVPMAQHEYDALVSFSYNVGSRAFCQSTLVRKLNAEDYTGACAELLRWRFFQGKDCALPTNARLCGGLATRREAEYRQCIGEAS